MSESLSVPAGGFVQLIVAAPGAVLADAVDLFQVEPTGPDMARSLERSSVGSDDLLQRKRNVSGVDGASDQIGELLVGVDLSDTPIGAPSR